VLNENGRSLVLYSLLSTNLIWGLLKVRTVQTTADPCGGHASFDIA